MQETKEGAGEKNSFQRKLNFEEEKYIENFVKQNKPEENSSMETDIKKSLLNSYKKNGFFSEKTQTLSSETIASDVKKNDKEDHFSQFFANFQPQVELRGDFFSDSFFTDSHKKFEKVLEDVLKKI